MSTKRDRGCAIDEDSCDGARSCKACKRLYELGWNAALEWLYDELDYSQEHEEIKDKIEEELK